MGLIKKLNKILFLAFFLLSVIQLFYKQPLPDPKELVDRVKNDQPFINIFETKTFQKEFNGVRYEFTQYADYQVTAVVVEAYDSDNWLDVTHEGDPAQTKDLCLVWGDNAKSGIYKKAKYSHGEFTCYYSIERSLSRDFNPRELTNNHLIPANDDIERKLKEASVGDQVAIKGTLVDYAIFDGQGRKSSFRKTSLTMSDNDCEVVLVEDFKIIKPAPFIARNGKKYSFIGLGTTAFTSILFFLL